MNHLYGTMENGQSYAITMKLIKSAKFYNTSISVRAYAQLKDGSFVYSDVRQYKVYNVADILYRGKNMNSLEEHNYLYNIILKAVNPDYEEVDYHWDDTIVAF